MALKLQPEIVSHSLHVANSRDILMIAQHSPVIELSEDELLARNVHNFIVPRIYPTSSVVHVEANRGVVTLRGRVGSFYCKQLWLSGAQRVAGVRRVIDEIDVVNSYPKDCRRV